MISAFDIFKIGIGPSSSHTVGPMNAGKSFIDQLVSSGELHQTTRIVVDLYKVRLNPTDGMAFINAELGNAPIKGKVLADTTKTADGALGQFGRMFIITAPA